MVTWIDALSRTRRNIAGALSRMFSPAAAHDESTIEELESTLLLADVPVRITADLVRAMDESYSGLKVSRRDILQKMLVQSLGGGTPFGWAPAPRPLAVLVVGTNGSGKTTTCAKLAFQARQQGRAVLLGAADTFRAAGSDQLRLWAKRVECDVVGGATGADAAAVAYDALDATLSRHLDTLILDTAGRMHTKEPLMQELRKIRSALGKRLAGAPHETWIVLDATLGQNAVTQARVFHEAVPLTGAVVAKLDGSSKAGFVFAITRELGVPIRFVGLGERSDDLAPFDPEEFVRALLAVDRPTENGA